MLCIPSFISLVPHHILRSKILWWGISWHTTPLTSVVHLLVTHAFPDYWLNHHWYKVTDPTFLSLLDYLLSIPEARSFKVMKPILLCKLSDLFHIHNRSFGFKNITLVANESYNTIRLSILCQLFQPLLHSLKWSDIHHIKNQQGSLGSLIVTKVLNSSNRYCVVRDLNLSWPAVSHMCT